MRRGHLHFIVFALGLALCLLGSAVASLAMLSAFQATAGIPNLTPTAVTGLYAVGIGALFLVASAALYLLPGRAEISAGVSSRLEAPRSMEVITETASDTRSR